MYIRKSKYRNADAYYRRPTCTTYRRAKFRIRSRVPCKLKRVANAGDERRSPARRGRVQRYSRRMSRWHRERHALAAVEVRRARHGRDSTRCACGKAAHYTLVSTTLSVVCLVSEEQRAPPRSSRLEACSTLTSGASASFKLGCRSASSTSASRPARRQSAGEASRRAAHTPSTAGAAAPRWAPIGTPWRG